MDEVVNKVSWVAQAAVLAILAGVGAVYLRIMSRGPRRSPRRTPNVSK